MGAGSDSSSLWGRVGTVVVYKFECSGCTMDYAQKQEEKAKYPCELLRGGRRLECPLTVMADSYKAGHFKMYPAAKVMSAYGEFRKPFEFKRVVGVENDAVALVNGKKVVKLKTEDLIKDNRIVFYGLRYFIEQFLSKRITEEDIKRAEKFYSEHNVGGTPYSFPRKIFDRIEELGYYPVKIEALREGSVIYPHTPVFIITAEDEFSHFCTFLETMLTMVWYPSCVATLSRHTKTLIERAFKRSVDPASDQYGLLDSRLHDFGFRGCTCIEQSVVGGSAHLLNFTGSDTMSAAYHVQFHMNKGNSIAQSIPATEHSVMTSWSSELEAIKNYIKQFPGSVIACVMDSYDYDNALNVILKEIKPDIENSKCTFIIRPDSGDPVDQVMKALKAADTHGFTFITQTVGGKNFKLFKNVGVIQGDGIDYEVVSSILDAVLDAGFSAANVAFGMGGGLLQKVNRDTMSFATKLSYIQYADGKERLVMKAPNTDSEKWSLPGKLMVLRNSVILDHPKVYPEDAGKVREKAGDENVMVTVYNHGKINQEYMDETFDVIRRRVELQWKQIPARVLGGVDSAISSWMAYERIIVAGGIHKWDKDKIKRELASEFSKYSASDVEKEIASRKFSSFLHSELQIENDCGGGRNDSLYRLDRILDDAMHGL